MKYGFQRLSRGGETGLSAQADRTLDIALNTLPQVFAQMGLLPLDRQASDFRFGMAITGVILYCVLAVLIYSEFARGYSLDVAEVIVMSLQSKLFRGDPKLEAAATSPPDHILPGAAGSHVAKIQQALIELDGAIINPGELVAKQYGPSTAAAVLSYKQKRAIVNRSYQTQADNIVGIMTMAALDREMLNREQAPVVAEMIRCRVEQHLA